MTVTVNEFIGKLLPYNGPAKVSVWLTNDIRDPGGTYALTGNMKLDKATNTLILEVEGPEQ